jgi:hypothetical protein
MIKVSVALGILIVHPAAQYDPLDLITFISKNFIPLNTMMERAGMSETDIYNRRDIFLYFKLPYDSEPPDE